MTPSEMFLAGKSQWPENFAPSLQPRSDIGRSVAVATGEVRKAMAKERDRRHREHARQPASEVCPGAWVYVHRRRFPSRSRGGQMWFGPYLVHGKIGRECTLVAGRHYLRVHTTQLKLIHSPSPLSASPPISGADEGGGVMTEAEMAAAGWYHTRGVEAHRQRGRTFEVCVRWSDDSVSWEPLSALIIPRLNGTLTPSEDLQSYQARVQDRALGVEIARLVGGDMAVEGRAVDAPLHPSASPLPISSSSSRPFTFAPQAGASAARLAASSSAAGSAASNPPAPPPHHA